MSLLENLASVGDIAAELGITRSAVGNWPNRYTNFPRPVTTIGGMAVYDRRTVIAWYARTILKEKW